MSWDAEIKYADVSGRFSQNARVHITKWPMCLVGERAYEMGVTLPRHDDEVLEIITPRVASLGKVAMDLVFNNDVDGLRAIRDEIVEIPREEFFKEDAKV